MKKSAFILAFILITAFAGFSAHKLNATESREVEETPLSGVMAQPAVSEGENTIEATFTNNEKSFFIEQEGLTTESVSISIHFKEGQILENFAYTLKHSTFGETEQEEQGTSNLIIFEKEIQKVIVTKNGENESEVRIIPIGQRERRVQPSSYLTNVRQKFFQNLGLNVVLRESWADSATSTWSPGYASSISKFVIHHTATNPTSNPVQAVQNIHYYHYHLCANGSGSYNPNNPDCDETQELWQDIGYNYLIDQHGTIYEGRAGGNGVTAAHSPPNSGTIGIAIIGNYSNSLPPAASIQSLELLMGRLAAINDVNLNWTGDGSGTVVAHRHRNSTACPGQAFYNMLQQVTNRANNIKTQSTAVKNLADEAKALTNPVRDDFMQVDSSRIQMIVKKDSISNELRTHLQSNAPTVNNFTEEGDYLHFNASKWYSKKIVTDAKAVEPGSIIQPNFKIKLQAWTQDGDRAYPADNEYDETIHWNLEMTNTPEAWKFLGGCEDDNLCGGSEDVVVAVIDTGVAYTDENFDAGSDYTLQNVSGFNFWVPGSSTPNGVYNEGYDRVYQASQDLAHLIDNDRIVAPRDFTWDFICSIRFGSTSCNAAELAKRFRAQDDNGHGTFVTTIIAGQAGNATPGDQNKLMGIAHNVRIMPIKAFFPEDDSMCYDSSGNHDPTCSDSDSPYFLKGFSTSGIIANAIEYARINGADVINMSFTGGGTDAVVQQKINEAYNAGVVLVAASGNNGGNVANYFPAGMNNVLAVGAVNQNGTKTSYSNFGSRLDVTAPVGGTPQIRSQWFTCSTPDTCWDKSNPENNMFTDFTSTTAPITSQGTSFAAPQVSALAALIKSKKPGIQPGEVYLNIKALSTDLGAAGVDNFTGHGVINIENSLKSIWGNWALNTGTTTDPIAVETFNGELVQAVRGNGHPYWIYVRRTSDGVFDPASCLPVSEPQIDKECWDRVGVNGQTGSQPALGAFGNRLYIAVRGTSNRIFIKSMDEGGVWDANWVELDGKTDRPIALTEFNGRLYVAVKGNGSTRIFVRSTTDGVFDGTPGEAWVEVGGSTHNELDIAGFNNQLFITARGATGRNFINKSNNGATWLGWVELPGNVATPISFGVARGRLYQSTSVSSGGIVTRFTEDGSKWTYWFSADGWTGDRVTTTGFNDTLYMYVRSTSSAIYSRYLL